MLECRVGQSEAAQDVQGSLVHPALMQLSLQLTPMWHQSHHAANMHGDLELLLPDWNASHSVHGLAVQRRYAACL